MSELQSREVLIGKNAARWLSIALVKDCIFFIAAAKIPTLPTTKHSIYKFLLTWNCALPDGTTAVHTYKFIYKILTGLCLRAGNSVSLFIGLISCNDRSTHIPFMCSYRYVRLTETALVRVILSPYLYPWIT